MDKDFQLGDVVKIISIGPTSTLALGAIVSIRKLPELNEANYYTIQAEDSSAYQSGYTGWVHTKFGKHCHNVHSEEIQLVSKHHTLPHIYTEQTKIPLI